MSKPGTVTASDLRSRASVADFVERPGEASILRRAADRIEALEAELASANDRANHAVRAVQELRSRIPDPDDLRLAVDALEYASGNGSVVKSRCFDAARRLRATLPTKGEDDDE